MRILFVYIPFAHTREDNRGLAEYVIRKRLERHGWTVWRGGCIGIARCDDIYPRVLRKYWLLERFLEQTRPGTIETLRYYAETQHGMPDFLCYRHGTWKFVECKFCHEQLSPCQKRCIPRLVQLGFVVEVHKLIGPGTKLRRALVDLASGDCLVKERQLRLRLRNFKAAR